MRRFTLSSQWFKKAFGKITTLSQLKGVGSFFNTGRGTKPLANIILNA